MLRHPLCRCVPAALAALFAACDDGGSSGPTDGGTDTDTDADADGGADAGDACVDTAAGTFPGDATELAYEEGGAADTIADSNWSPITGTYGTYVIGEEPMWEAVRFDVLAPATIYGARVQWGNLVGEGVRPVRLGAYADFGSNGFDFYQWEALWEGDRCLAPEDDGAWVDYVFDEPIELDQPGLFYIAHFWDDPSEPLLEYDPTLINDGTCALYGDCHSALNLPGADEEAFYNGMSFSFPYDFGVRLLVALHDTIPAEDKWFQPNDALTASSRVAWGDYDNDGWDDLMTNGPVLYHNNGDGTFTDVTAAAGLGAVSAGSGGGVFGDYDNDGWLDYFGLGTGMTAADILLHNDGDGTFSDVTAESLISDLADVPDCDATMNPEYSPTEGAGWVDLDTDGFLDLYLAEYECGTGSAAYTNYLDRFFRNQGDGTFVEWTTGHGFSTVRHAGRGVSPADYDQDGYVDIFVSNYRLDPNFLFHNNGDGTVTNMGSESNLAGVGDSLAYGHTIGAAWIDADHDGDFDMLLSNLAHPRYYQFSDRTQLMINDGSGVFTDTAAEAGIIYRETHSNPTVQDFDNDGDQDIFITCVYDGRFSEMYFNNGDATFDQVNYESGAIVYNGWGGAASDYDRDGDVDLVAYTLFENVTAAEGNNWIQVRTLGGTSSEGLVNAAGIGAVVTVTVDGEPHLGQTSGGSGTGCQDTAFLVFGLGAAETVDSIEVLYPGGAVVTVPGPVAANQRVWIQADGTVTYGFDHPL